LVEPARSAMPRDFLGILLFLFVVGSVALFGQGHLAALGLLLTGSYALYFLKQKKPIPTELVIYFAWVFWSLTGFMVCRNTELYINSLMLIVQIWLMTFAVAGITMQRGMVGTNFLALIVGGIVMVAASYATGEFAISSGHEVRLRMQGITANPNHYAYILLIAIMACLYFLRSHFRPTARIFLLLVVAVSAYGIIYSASRKAFIGFLVLIPLWGWMCYRKELFKRKSYLVTLVLVVAALILLTDFMLSDTYMGFRFKYDFVDHPITQRHDEHQRVAFYREGYKIIKGNPLFGIGLGNFQALSRYSTYSHSDYIEVASSTGVVGFIMYFSIYGLLWRRLTRIQRFAQGEFMKYDIGLLKASIFVILLLAFGRPNLYSHITWVLMGSAIGYAWSLQIKVDSMRKLYSNGQRR